MQHKTLCIVLTCIIAVMMCGSTYAGSQNQDLLQVYRNSQKQALAHILKCFREGAERRDWSKGIRSLVRAEMGMINYGVSYRGENFYSKLAEDLGPSQYALIGWRIFVKRLQNMGYDFASPDKMLQGSYRIRPANSSEPYVSIRFDR